MLLRFPTLLITLLGLSHTPVMASEIADQIFFNAHIISDSKSQKTSEALAIKGQRILAVGSQKSMEALKGKNTKMTDLNGRTVFPGLHEGHGHLLRIGQKITEVDLSGLRSKDLILKRLKDREKKLAKGQWLIGTGWDQNLWENKSFPSIDDLKSINQERPIYLRRVDGHAIWVNQKALDLAGITKQTTIPLGGIIHRNPNGSPNGILIDNAMLLVENVMPKMNRDEKIKAIKAAITLANSLGLTAFHDAGTDRETIDIYESLHKKGELNIRLNVMVDGHDPSLVQMWWKRGPLSTKDDMLLIRSFKLSLDGALGSRGAHLLEDYSDKPGQRGLSLIPPNKVKDIVEGSIKTGFQLAIHAIGDKANRDVLNIYEEALRKHPQLDHRFRIEHAQILDEKDIHRFAKLNIIASMQGTHCTSDSPWVPIRIGQQRTNEGAYVWQKLLKSGAKLVGGSDAPVESLNPYWGIYSSMTRQNHSGQPLQGWNASQRMSFSEALTTYTQAASYAMFLDQRSGTLSKGMLADFTVIDKKNFDGSNPKELIHVKTHMTVVAGRTVFKSSQTKKSELSH
ncbi:MAG: amidohydrolase [Pseudobacteriovorax sp.]|nr:amidohydrolase [Pseudobacteriovorax sp.]